MTMLMPGFADPVSGSQQIFRALLHALSRPGVPVTLPDTLDTPPPGLGTGIAASLLTLVDQDTCVAYFNDNIPQAARDWCHFHTGAPVATAVETAEFIVVSDSNGLDLSALNLGTDEYPDSGATLLIEVASLGGEPATIWAGPGLAAPVKVGSFGLDDGFWQQRIAIASAFPRGIDIFFFSGNEVVGLPRSTAILRKSE